MDPSLNAFADELEKIATAVFSHKLRRQFAARLGRRFRKGTRPIRVATLLRNEKRKFGEYVPTMGPEVGNNNLQELWAKNPKKKGDVPSRDDMDTGPKKIDGRDNAATVYGPGVAMHNIAGTGFPQGGSVG